MNYLDAVWGLSTKSSSIYGALVKQLRRWVLNPETLGAIPARITRASWHGSGYNQNWQSVNMDFVGFNYHQHST